MRSPRTATKSSPRLPQLEKARTQQRRPNTAKRKEKKKKTHHKVHWCWHGNQSVIYCLQSVSLDITSFGTYDSSVCYYECQGGVWGLETHPGPGLEKALGIQRNKAPVTELDGSWSLCPTDRCSASPLPSKESLKEICIPLINSLVAKSRFLLQFQLSTGSQ